MLLDSIRNRLDTLSKSEHKVALAVLAKPELTIAENISALARLAQVSEPTVVRFCRTLGLDGWHEFKLKLAQSLALAPKLSDSAMRQDDLMVDLVDKICNRSVNALLDLRSSLNVHRVEQALAVLSRASPAAAGAHARGAAPPRRRGRGQDQRGARTAAARAQPVAGGGGCGDILAVAVLQARAAEAVRQAAQTNWRMKC